MSLLFSYPRTTFVRSLLLVWATCVLVNATSPWTLEERGGDLTSRTPVRRLAAAHARTPIKPRAAEPALRHDHELHYMEGKLIDRQSHSSPFQACYY